MIAWLRIRWCRLVHKCIRRWASRDRERVLTVRCPKCGWLKA